MLRSREGAVRAVGAIGVAVLVFAGSARALVICAGNCDGLGGISAGELLTGIGIALEENPSGACPAAAQPRPPDPLRRPQGVSERRCNLSETFSS